MKRIQQISAVSDYASSGSSDSLIRFFDFLRFQLVIKDFQGWAQENEIDEKYVSKGSGEVGRPSGVQTAGNRDEASPLSLLTHKSAIGSPKMGRFTN